jgi:3-oxoacyl-[acyl-carrier protein] reductase
LGAELVSGFLDRQYGVVTLSRTKTAFITNMLRAGNRRRFHWSAVDGRDHEGLRAFVKEAGERFGRIDVLVNNAGTAMEGVLPTMRTRDIVEIIAVNLTAAVVLAQTCSRFMLRQRSGCIVNISSVHAIRGHSGIAVYSATKAALDGLTRSLARELGPYKIRVNSVAPGYFDSDMFSGMGKEEKQRIARRTPLGRLARIDEIANAVHFLTSEQASFITGQTLVVDGGITC